MECFVVHCLQYQAYCVPIVVFILSIQRRALNQRAVIHLIWAKGRLCLFATKNPLIKDRDIKLKSDSNRFMIRKSNFLKRNYSEVSTF